jgi:hypothetical protein
MSVAQLVCISPCVYATQGTLQHTRGRSPEVSHILRTILSLVVQHISIYTLPKFLRILIFSVRGSVPTPFHLHTRDDPHKTR